MKSSAKLTDAALRAAKPGSRPYKLYDGRGLYILVKSDGAKYWRFKYRIAGREKGISFGTYPEVSLQLARERLREARRLVASGVDPSEARKAEKRAMSDSELADVADNMLIAASREEDDAAEKFETWFVKQHGRRPNRFDQTDAELRTEVRAGEEAARELQERQEWDARWTSALWAWQVRKSWAESRRNTEALPAASDRVRRRVGTSAAGATRGTPSPRSHRTRSP